MVNFYLARKGQCFEIVDQTNMLSYFTNNNPKILKTQPASKNLKSN